MKFALGTPVTIKASGETGEVIARAEYASRHEATYLVHYKAANGCATEQWWGESALTATE